MKNASLLKSKPETPKTPGGISKSLLTPCRRVGLSRNWKKNVISPFNSPLANSESKEDATRKRKESLEETPSKNENDEKNDSVGTPARKLDLPRRKRSKTLLNSIIKPDEDDCAQLEAQPKTTNEADYEESLAKDVEFAKADLSNVTTNPALLPKSTAEEPCLNQDFVQDVSTPVRLKSKSKSKKRISHKSNIKANKTENNKKDEKTNEVTDIEKENLKNINKLSKLPQEKTIKMDTVEQHSDKTKENSPNNLTKECIVVIQKKIFKNQLLNSKLPKNESDDQHKSQALFNDSDSDEMPLNCLNKPTNDPVETITIDDDDDFTPSKTLKTTNKTIIEKKPPSNKIIKQNTSKPKESNKTIHQPSQSSIDDDDEFFEKKKTILVRKTYEKVIKPLKAKSTGSITQKDIEDLKARIELKKKMLLAKSMTDTKELRELVKKWQKGCQDALMELMELMKNKCPEQKMEYSEMLQTLKIPPNLVGYDSDNDCFVTPEDENIILSHIKE